MKDKPFAEQVRIYKEVAKRYGREDIVVLCRDLEVTKSELQAMAFRLRKAGVDIPKIKGGYSTILRRVMDELKIHDPQLFKHKPDMPRDRISRILAGEDR